MEKLSPAVDGNIQGSTIEQDQGIKSLRALTPRWNVFIKSLPSGLRDLCQRGDKRIVRA